MLIYVYIMISYSAMFMIYINMLIMPAIIYTW